VCGPLLSVRGPEVTAAAAAATVQGCGCPEGRRRRLTRETRKQRNGRARRGRRGGRAFTLDPRRSRCDHEPEKAGLQPARRPTAINAHPPSQQVTPMSGARSLSMMCKELYFTLLYIGPSRADGNAAPAGPVRQCRDRTCHEVQVSERTHHSSIHIIHQRYWVGGRAGLTTESIDAGPRNP
jgi:hypothetical protein